MSRLHFIVLACFVSAIFCGVPLANKWHAVLQFPDGSAQSIWVDNTNTQAPRIKLMEINQVDSSSLSNVIRENQMYGVYQNLTTAKCVSFENLNQQDIALLQAVLNFSNGATYAGQVFQDEVCDLWFNFIDDNSDLVSMCVNKDGTPVSISVNIQSFNKVFTARMTQFTTKFSSSVFNVPKGCSNSPNAI